MKTKLVVSFILLMCFNQVLLAQNYGNWRNVDTMKYKIRDHASILLPDGNVLVTGGLMVGGISKNSEIFNVAKEKWESALEFNKPRASHNLVMLNSGKIMAIGGYFENSCEILYDSKWVITDTFTTKRNYGQSSIVLDNGDVLLIGGLTDYPVTKTITILDDCQVFDSNKLKWKSTGTLNIARYYHSTTKLLDGRVLATGGFIRGGIFTNTCEIYDPILGKWTITDTLKENRAKHEAILLNDGKVFVFGGYRTTTELFDPVKEKWSTVGYAPAEDVKGALINNGESILYINGPTKYSCGWGIISLKDYSRKYFKLFGKWVYAQSITKINEEKALIAGGMEIKGDGLYYTLVNEAKLFDYNLTGIKAKNANVMSTEDVIVSSYPNPFNELTNLSVNSPSKSQVQIELFNMLGEKMADIFNGELVPGANNFPIVSNKLNSGIYLVAIKANNKVNRIKIVLLR